VADSLLPGEAVLILCRETQQHRAEQDSDHEDSKRDFSRHKRNVGMNMPRGESPIGVKCRTRVSRANSLAWGSEADCSGTRVPESPISPQRLGTATLSRVFLRRAT
jgi:hypothetical protein